MKLHEIRNRVQEVITALHDRGWHSEAFALSNDLYDIGHRPLMADALMVLEDAERLEEELAEPQETWFSHPSLTAEERNPSLR
jgi:hypothetical protein